MRNLTALAASALLLLALTGCAVSVTDEPAEGTPAASAPEKTPEEIAEEPADEPVDEPDDESQTAVTAWSEETAAERDAALAIVTKQVSCDGELVLGDSETGQVIRIDGACDHLVLHLVAGVIIAGDVGTLDVYGTGNVVYVDGIDALNVSGSAGVVQWLGTTPQINDTGVGNILTAG